MRTERWTVADLLRELGDIPPDRIRMKPTPGTAKKRDVVNADIHENRLCELIDGVLVEKTTGYRESLIAMIIGKALLNFINGKKLGVVLGTDGSLEILHGIVRLPDVCYIARENLPGGKLPLEAIPSLVPDIAVEVLSRSNTKAEMKRKRREYFEAGTQLVWEIDPRKRIATVYTADVAGRVLKESETLDGGNVLPGFKLKLKDLFAELD
ncbi:MAG TPA: Uma2 family endonuclease [Planctomycetota bacterium]|nr:Uma2 family endonuclease [Planctomycetota bacterium]